MELSKNMCELVANLEYIIGSECYNPNSYDGWNDIEGCSFRYPINLPDDKGIYTKVRSNLNDSYLINREALTPAAVSFMKYRFGSNELYIGKGLIKVLEFLEERYGINFDQLESQLKDD